ncbi:uncharacterized protein [Littorina saxatilis]|uniref:uncharacterized protein n=1 Tax=Littorina saxatilis TaxID=31220 RepID=UPI0038B5D04D
MWKMIKQSAAVTFLIFLAILPCSSQNATSINTASATFSSTRNTSYSNIDSNTGVDKMSNETDKPAPLESSKADHVPVPSVKICDGFECFADEFCSNSENRCRSCELFKTFCNDSDLIHQKAPACETYCQKILVEELEKECSADLNSTFTELQERIGAKETEWRVLTNQSKESLTKCSRAQYQLTSRLEERDKKLSIACGVAAVQVFLLVGSWAAFFWIYRRQMRRHYYIVPQGGPNIWTGEDNPIGPRGAQLGKLEANGVKNKQPTEVDRWSVHLDPERHRMVPSGKTDDP